MRILQTKDAQNLSGSMPGDEPTGFLMLGYTISDEDSDREAYLQYINSDLGRRVMI